MNVFDSFKEAINAGQFLPEEVKMLRDGFQEIAGMEAVQDYCCPSVERWMKEYFFIGLK